MEYQQLPPVSMIIGTPNQSQSQASHLHNLTNSNNNNNNGSNNQQLLTMQPPLLPLQVAHNLHQLTSQNGNSHGLGNATQNQNTQSLPPTTQLLQAIHNNTQQHPNMNGNGNNNTGNNTSDNNAPNDENNRWTQYQVQQLWRHHAYLNGKTSNKDICGDDKHKEDGDPWNVEAQAAFLGPNLWDKTLPYDTNLKVHQYADLDEFLSENGIPVDGLNGLPSSHLGHSASMGNGSGGGGGGVTNNRNDLGLSLGLSAVTKRERSPSPSDCMSPDTINNPPSPADSTFSMSSSRDFDPRTRAFSDEDLKPQPMIKKSRKQFVPDEMKDDKYWARRRKNNMAAKRSRDARRMKENQIALRAGYLEKENMNLHREVEQLKQENMELRARLSKYQEV
ncbi:hypothetical protein PVAND_011407 [Polypedilum vanderplanki]|uniref:BZIP domain-containing protein n=1 Tax=Polypedilum vanderplanki TaxID=319348 RepID=A0A9J6CJ84_POLVA|nr:hypothetical protein PVAND_011407 [Polypedilum vanderplanki]